MIISRTPSRISLFGGGTDYPAYYLRKKGAVLGTTINKYVYISLNRLSQFFDYKFRISYSKAELVNEIDEIVHPSVRECLRHKNLQGFLDIHIFSDLPARTGLGLSSAFTVGFLQALYALEGKLIKKLDLAKEAIHIEQQMIQENVGSQDQVHAALGGLNIIEFDKDEIKTRPVRITPSKSEKIQESLLMFFTGMTRTASDIAAEQIKNTEAKENDDYLGQMYQTVFRAEEIIASYDDQELIERLGCLLHESWLLKRKLSSKVSNSEIDHYYMKAMEAGAHGGKLLGAGSGGFLLFLVPNNKKNAVIDALKELLLVDFKFDHSGSSIIYMA